MRILRSMMLCFLCLILLTTSAGAANHETSYDIYAKPDGKTSWQIQIENDKPIYQSDKTVGQMMADEATATEEFAHIWYNLLQGEMAQGIDVKDSFASDIYKGMTEKQVLISMIAEDADAVCMNYIVGVFNKKKDTRFKQYFGNIYWIEWNTEDQKLQATNLVDSVEQLKDAYDIMYSYLYYSWMINAAGGNTILNKQLPLDSVLFQLTGGKKLQNALNEVYAEQNNGLKPFKTASPKTSGVTSKKDTQAKKTEPQYSSVDISKIKAGSVLSFGHYPQTSGGKDNTPIEWRVLALDGHNALLLSAKVLDCQKYHSKAVKTSWEKCALRKWLNGTFLKKAFTAQEQKAILTTEVDNSYYTGYNNKTKKWDGVTNKTKDKIFLLKDDDIKQYLTIGQIRSIGPSDYAVSKGAVKAADSKGDQWWLRTMYGTSQDYANTYDNRTPGSYIRMYPVNWPGIGVCPALWVNLEADAF